MQRRSLPTPGMRLGKYELIDHLAVGGMAEIFLARSVGIEGFEKLVVCKCILRERAADEDYVRMFTDEARLAATLHHPNVAQVFDIGREDDLHFFTMEYVQGADLREILHAARSRGGVPLDHAVAIVLGVAAGLHYAHEKTDRDGHALGIVHRDVSPSNVLVSFDGGVKVVDFGIAKATSQWARTRTGTIKGKVSCMSPEQCRGEAIDRRSDIFAIGVLLYELTCGARPFAGESDYAIIHQIVDQDAPPPSTRRPDYPPALEAIVMRALRRDRDERYATAQELQVDLETFARDQGLVISPIELARYMEELFGGQRPTRTTVPAERFVHPDPRVPAGTALAPAANAPAVGLRRSWIAGGLAAAVVLGAAALLGRERTAVVTTPPPPTRVAPTTPEPSSPTPTTPPAAPATPPPAALPAATAAAVAPTKGAAPPHPGRPARRTAVRGHAHVHARATPAVTATAATTAPAAPPAGKAAHPSPDLDAPFPR